MGILENAGNAYGGRARTISRRALGTAALLAAAFLALSIGGEAGRADTPQPHRLAVLPFEIDDNSGEAGAATRHDAMLASITREVAQKIEADKLYDVVPPARVAEAVAAANPGTYLRQCNGCERDIARSVGADRVMIGWIFKMSSLVLSLHVVVKDVATGKVLYAHAFDFRGDDQRAWTRAADYMVAALKRGAEQQDVHPTN